MVATQIFFIFTPNPGEMIKFDEHIFQMGWLKTTNQSLFFEKIAPKKPNVFSKEQWSDEQLAAGVAGALGTGMMA